MSFITITLVLSGLSVLAWPGSSSLTPPMAPDTGTTAFRQGVGKVGAAAPTVLVKLGGQRGESQNKI